MKEKVSLNQLSKTVRAFISNLITRDGIILDDGHGHSYDLHIKELKTTDKPRRSKAQLPTWPGKVIGSLHRSDIYDDLH